MRVILGLVLLATMISMLPACASVQAENAAKPAATQPANPLNGVTNPMNQPGPGVHDTMH